MATSSESGRGLPAEVTFSITGNDGRTHTLAIRDRFLNEVLRRDVISVSLVSGAVEGSTRWLAARLNEAEGARRASSSSESTRSGEHSTTASNPMGSAGMALGNVPAAHDGSRPAPTGSSSSSLDGSSMQPYRELAPVYEDDEEFSQIRPPVVVPLLAPREEREPTLMGAIARVAATDTALFFELVSEFYEISRAPTISGGNGGEVWTLREHCPGFQLCCAVFAEVYNARVRPAVWAIRDFGSVTMVHIGVYRRAVLDTFRLRPEGPGITSSSQAAVDEAWVRDYVEHDPYFFHEHVRTGAGATSRHASAALMTVSAVPSARTMRRPSQGDGAAAGDTATKENEMPTYYMNDLLKSPSWEPDDASTRCRLCDRSFVTRWPPFVLRSHHCRSCGRRLCVACTSYTAHRTFAKLTKPNSTNEEEGDMRHVCRACFHKYGEVERLRYLGALFALSGLTVADLSLCRTVNLQWRQAAELCLSEYRLLLHQCERDLRTVLTPVGVLLQNSIDLIISTTTGSDAGSPASPSKRSGVQAPHLHIHPEPALVLLKFIAAKGQWSAPSTEKLLAALATCEPHHIGCGTEGVTGAAAPPFSHWHFYCTAFCTQMLPAYFAVRAAEQLCAAPASVEAASAAVAHLAERFLSPAALRATCSGGKGGGGRRRGAPGGSSGSAAGAHRSSLTAAAAAAMHSVMEKFSNKSVALPSGAQPSTAGVSPQNLSGAKVDVLESAVVWLLELLYRDAAQRDPARRRYEPLLNATLPAIAAASVREAFVMTCSFQSCYAECRYDPELLGAWRTRILKEVGGPAIAPVMNPAAAAAALATKSEVQATFAATMRFFGELDAYCQQHLNRAGARGLESWLLEYCRTGDGGPGSLTLPAEQPADPAPGSTSGVGGGGSGGGFASGGVAVGSLYGAPRGFSTSYSGSLFPSHAGGSGATVGVYMDLPHPIFNPFKPGVLLKSVRVSHLHVEAKSSTRPVWLSFSTFSDSDRALASSASISRSSAADASAAGPSWGGVGGASADEEAIFMFLYKLENAERDQLMCASGRLMELLLRDRIGDARLTSYSVLPLSSESALIEPAEAHTLSKLPGVSATGDLAAYLSRLGLEARRNFLVSAKMFLLLNYVFSIGDRHAGNVMVSYHGAILHIDFGYIFSNKTTEERLAGSSIRIDSPFLAAVTSSRAVLREHDAADQSKRGGRPVPRGERGASNAGRGLVSDGVAAMAAAGVQSGSTTGAPAPVSFVEEHAAFFNEAADWFLALRPHSSVFYELWLYAVNRRTLEVDPGKLALAFNMLFDRSTSRESCHHKFASTMRSSVNVCRFKDATYYSMQTLKSYREQLGERVSTTYDGALRALGSVWAPSR